jgi:glycosyltransferase involved in cell wall biosynthesis
MKITVIICTYNRCQDLAKALNSISVSELPDSVQWEVLVVDNNSNDQTRAIVEDLCRQYPGRFRYVFEPKQGLSNARNAGIRAARGEILAFTDDDVMVDPLWLQNLTAPMLDSQWAGAGGRIRLGQDFQPPRWLTLSGPFDLGGTLVQFDLGDEQRPLNKAPFGANMAFRKIMFETYGGFRPDLDRSGKSLIGNGDTELGERLMAAGERLWYAPSAVVHHPVPKERLKKSYMRAWWFGHGRSLIRQTGEKPSAREIPKRCYWRLADALRMLFVFNSRWFLYPQCRFYWETRVCLTAGEIVEILQLGRRKSPKNSAMPGRDPTLGSSS